MQDELAEGVGNADIYSLSKLAQFMMLGSIDYSSEDLEGHMSPEMLEFIKKSESDNPY